MLYQSEQLSLFLNSFGTLIEGMISKSVQEALDKLSKPEQQPPSQEEIYVTKKQLGQKIHLTEFTISRMVKRGIIPSHNIGRRVLFKMSEVDAALKANIIKGKRK